MIRFARPAAILLLSAATVSGCAATGPTARDGAVAATPSADPSAAATAEGTGATPAPTPESIQTGTPGATGPATPKPAGKKPAGKTPSAPATAEDAGPRIVYLRVARKPRCAEGTAVFRADPVPLVIEWKITGATGGALSVDDPTNTPGTYGPVDLQGSQEFLFSCNGDVGSTETHTYTLYTVGGGPVRSATVTASAKVLDKGLGMG
ncbi:hypothetical protein ACGFIG_15450 [Micromonospora sp. NPDC049048]|uniref:hypothetical protein n=1 Tax=Micromonospora sp. NPDC049048 TaxID=3364263 RepID=UPI0037135FB8